jgi:MFS family permease
VPDHGLGFCQENIALKGVFDSPPLRLSPASRRRRIVFGLGFFLRWAFTSLTCHYLTEWFPVIVMTGIGVGLVLPALAAAAVHSLPKDRLAVGSGVNQAIRQIGPVLWVAITIALVSAARGSAALGAFCKLFWFWRFAVSSQRPFRQPSISVRAPRPASTGHKSPPKSGGELLKPPQSQPGQIYSRIKQQESGFANSQFRTN